MEELFNDTAKFIIFGDIELNLFFLKQNASEEEIQNIINQIPSNMFNEKEDLMIICQIFALYARNSPLTYRRNSIKLFEKIMTPIKAILNDESSFFWDIFGGHFYLKHLMYTEGLISIDQIIQSILIDNFSKACDYFLPEIIEERSDIFEKELKYKYNIQYTEQSLTEFRILRQKHFQWLRESGDFKNVSYKEIEKDTLRYSIKTDDVDTFQRILSNLNLSINSTILESVLDNFLREENSFP